MTELYRKTRIMALSTRIKYHRAVMDAEHSITDDWKRHARSHATLCRMRADLLTNDERRVIEHREGLA